MQFYSDGHIYKAASITGPTHNFLEVEFALSNIAASGVLVESVQLKLTEPVRLSSDEVQRWAEEGVREANEEVGTDYRLKRIKFVASDSPPSAVYRELARRIVLRLHASPSTFNGVEE